ncbi:MAG: WhiB family transcriptional regulator [Flaviflexus sp.]|nr:WhiB family transcriptional regulator [Flaviflexus sp.]
MASIRTLPGPQPIHWEWQHHGRCRTKDPDLFFHPEGERGGPRKRRVEAAKKICLSCPVLTQCRDHALRVGEPYGIWGGMSEEERHNYLSRRRIRRVS